MSGINILSRNLVAGSTYTLTTGTANAQFPLANIENDSPAVKFRSTTNTVVIQFDLLQNTEIDAVALHGDTNATLGLTSASFKTSLTTDFTLSTSTDITLNATERFGFAFRTGQSHRYLELTLTGGGSFVEISNIFIGKRSNIPTQNLGVSGFTYGFVDQSTQSTNQYGQVFVDKRNAIKTLSGPLDYCIDSEQSELDEIFSRHGTSTPLWLIVDPDSNSLTDARERLSIYGYLQDRPQWSASGGQTWNTSVSVRQAG